MRYFFAICLMAAFLSACAGRKISQVGLREPSSVEKSSGHDYTEIRSRLATLQDANSQCPGNLTKQIQKIAFAEVIPPRCPARLAYQVQAVNNMLLLEERSLLEEIVSSQCQAIFRSQPGERLQNFVETFDTTGPLGRRKNIIESVRAQDDDISDLTKLRENLRELLFVSSPIERWIMRNGKYLLPEEELEFLYGLLAKQDCRMNGTDFERLYRLQQSIENLEPMLPDVEQQHSLKLFIEALHKITDRKVKEFFYPQ